MNLVDAVKESLSNPTQNLPDYITNISGMSGLKYKQFINKLVSNKLIKNYLEIGVWKGSTVIPALYNNISRLQNYWVIDDFSQFGGPIDEFKNNFKRCLNAEPNLINKDCFSINPKDYNINKIDLYFYDGDHGKDEEIENSKNHSQYKALDYYLPYMNDTFIFIVDDWDHYKTSYPTYRAIKDLGLTILYQKDEIEHGVHAWHEGCGIFVLQK